jgi:hypothetical protein
VLSPTKLEISEAINIDDIIFSGSQAAGDAICHQSEQLTSPKFL